MFIRFLEISLIVLLDLALLGRVLDYAYNGLRFITTYLPLFGPNKGEETEPVENPVDEGATHPKYDVEAFRQRILAMQTDKDGLYDVPPQPVKTDFTGTEIVTENFEKEIDRRFNL